MKAIAIIPAYNEEESIVQTVLQLQECLPDVDYIVINDGSTDGTRDLCIEHAFNFIDLPVNIGLSAGFQAGMKYADRFGYDCAFQYDADGQHVPDFVPSMASEMKETGADIVIGSRFITEKKETSARMMGSRLISLLIRVTTGRKLSDPTSGMRLYNRAMIERFAREYDFGPEPDTVAYLLRKGAKVSEVQVDMREREAGESYLTMTASFKYMMRICISIIFVQWFR